MKTWQQKQDRASTKKKHSVYRRLKAEGITGQLEYAHTFTNREAGENGWNFEMKDGRRGKVILGQEAIQWSE